MRVALANVTSLRLHTVADWRAEVVLITETRRVMRAQAGASGWQAFWGAPLESRGGGHLGCAGKGVGILVRQGNPSKASTPPQGGAPHRVGRPGRDTLALHPLVRRPGWIGPGADTLYAQVAYAVSAQPALNRTF